LISQEGTKAQSFHSCKIKGILEFATSDPDNPTTWSEAGPPKNLHQVNIEQGG